MRSSEGAYRNNNKHIYEYSTITSLNYKDNLLHITKGDHKHTDMINGEGEEEILEPITMR